MDGTLAGSILKFSDGVKNMLNFSGCRLEDTIEMVSVNPAKQLNIFDRKGSIAIDKDADIVVLNDQNEVALTYCRGVLSYRKGDEIK